MNEGGSGLGERLLVVAFGGWNDAGDAASGAVREIVNALNLDAIAELDPEEYIDYQFTRPKIVSLPDGAREIEWPVTTLWGPHELDPFDEGLHGLEAGSANPVILAMEGPEPARSWRHFTQEIVDMALTYDIDGVILLGAMLADVPHTRPISIFVSSEDPDLRLELGIERSSYEGPVGILSVLSEELTRMGMACVSVWASVPHYVQAAPSPKATLALVRKVQALTGREFSVDDLAASTLAWEVGIDALAGNDEDMANYIRELERARDTVDSPEASGEAIAEEFERYLRRRGDGPEPPKWNREP